MLLWCKFHIIIYFSPKEGGKAENLPGDAWQSEAERVYSQDCSFENSTYHVGDFVYVQPSEPNLKPHIVCIERLWEDEAGDTLISFLQLKKNQLATIHICVFNTVPYSHKQQVLYL